MKTSDRLEDRLTATIADLYGAAADERLWASISTDLRDMTGAVSVIHAVVDRPAGRLIHQNLFYDDPRVLERYYDERIDRLDPQLRFSAQVDRSRLWTDRDHLDLTQPDTAEFCHWVDSNTTIGSHISTAAVIDGGATMNVFSLHRHRRDGPIPEEQSRLMAALLPHLHRASELAFLHAEKVTAGYWDGLLAGRDAACLIGRDRRVLRTTAALDRLLTRGDGLDIVGEGLRAADCNDDAGLQAAIGRALAGPAATGTRVHRRSGRAPLAIAFYPIARAQIGFAREEAVLLATIIDPTVPPVAAHCLYAQIFGLTPRETGMAALLMAGHSVESAAAAGGISPHTARIHLRQLFAKTGTSRQAELVRLLSRL